MAINAVNEASDEQQSGMRDQATSKPAFEQARERVAEYLRAVGVADRLRTAALADEIVSACEARGRCEPAACVAEAQARVERFRRGLFGEREAEVDPLWFRSFTAAHPDAFLADPGAARELANRFGDPFQGRPPARAQFAQQSFQRLAFPRWALGLLPATLITCAATAVLLRALGTGGLSALEVSWTLLFSGLCFLASVGMTTAVLGFFAKGACPREPSAGRGPIPATALLVPIYHESAEHVFAAVAAMRESLLGTPGGEAFEIFVLSDSRDPACAAEEERAHRRVAASVEPGVPVYYRRRSRNDRQKAGNLAEFFERFGHRYTYAVILDADSLMRGDTLVEMVRRMEMAPQVGLLQAPLSLHRAETLFARAQQFVASVCGPMFMRGLALWAGPHANYYGHNAVVRVRAFLECCALPVLSGEPPLGGHILSHDFVEAALLCRAGWEVRMAPDLSGSWEELPPTLPDFVARDRRWCQGNLQHLRIAMARGLLPMSRVHMLVGAAQYLASPAWLLFVGMGIVLAERAEGLSRGTTAWVLTLGTALVLLLPRALGLIEVLRDGSTRRAHGGSVRLVLSALVEGSLSLAIAPVLMLHHTRIIGSILLGRTVRWGAQARRARGELSKILQAEWLSTLLGVLLASVLWLREPALALLLSPIWLFWVLAIPLSLLASSAGLGRALMGWGIFSVPSETEPDELARCAEDLRALTASDACARFRDLVLDPVLNHAHVARLELRAAPELQAQLARLCEKALRGGPTALQAAERKALLADPTSMRQLHREAWQRWPVESFLISRSEPQLPSEAMSLPNTRVASSAWREGERKTGHLS